MTIKEIKKELQDRIKEQEQFEARARMSEEFASASFHTGKASGLEDALELLNALDN